MQGKNKFILYSVQNSQYKLPIFLISGQVILLSFLYLIGVGPLLILAFPLSTLAIGAYFYFYVPELYIGYTLFLWFSNPLIRRLIDYKVRYFTVGGMTTVSQFLTLICIISFVKYLPTFCKKQLFAYSFPFIICTFSVLYGACLGVTQTEIKNLAIVQQVLSILCPILFGFHILSRWKEYRINFKIIVNTFRVSVVLMGIYGIIQFIASPPWDLFYLSFGIVGAQGSGDVAFGLRGFGTQTSAHVFAFILSSSLLVLMVMVKPSLINIMSVSVGFIAILLTSVRTAWIGLLIGILLFVFSRMKLKSHLTILISFTTSVILVVLTYILFEEFSVKVDERVETFLNLGNDRAVNYRLSNYEQAFDPKLFSLIGRGYNIYTEDVSDVFNGDGTILPTLFNLGFIVGNIFLICSLFWIMGLYLMSLKKNSDDSCLLASVVLVSLTPMLFSAFLFAGSNAIVYWTFLALGLSSQIFQRYSKLIS